MKFLFLNSEIREGVEYVAKLLWGVGVKDILKERDVMLVQSFFINKEVVVNIFSEAAITFEGDFDWLMIREVSIVI